MLVEIDGCIFDKRQFKKSHGFEQMDSVGKEAFVNHVHLNGHNKERDAQALINSWTEEMKSKWLGKKFKIYKQIEPHEIILRFHIVREDEPDWCDSGLEIIEVKT